MKLLMVFISILALQTAAFAQKAGPGDIGSAGDNESALALSTKDSRLVGEILRAAEQSGNINVQFGGGPQVTTYSVNQDEVTCYFQNSDDSVTCTAKSAELSPAASDIISKGLRRAEQSGNKSIRFEGSPQVTVYSTEKLSCYFQNSDDSATCQVQK